MNNKAKSLVLISTILIPNVQAEIITDGSLGGASQNLPGPNYNIHEGFGHRQGTNVFHSFSQFNINAGENAHFNTSGLTHNILARITGGDPSLIDGLISSNSSANLWLMNPAGWIVGQNAQLNLQGSFHLSTANSIGFTSGEMFFADPVSQSILSAAAPIDYQFNPGSQAKITLDQADLIMPEGKDISLMGGDILMKNSSVSAPGGRILLASNAGQGKWHFDTAGLTQMSGSGGTIDIEHDSESPAGLLSPSLNSSNFLTDTSAGTLQITASQINLKHAYIVTQSWEDKDAGDTTLQADSINLDASFIDNKVQGSKNAGNVHIIASDLKMDNKSKISTDTSTGTTGEAGDIRVDLKGQLYMTDNSGMTSTALGNRGGDITVNSDNIVLNDASVLRVATQSDSNAGNLNIITNQLVLTEKGTLDTATVFGQGKGGDISVKADKIALSQDGLISSASFAEGQAGNIDIQANNMLLEGNSEIRGSSLRSGTTGTIRLAINGLLKADKSSINTIALESDGGSIQVESKALALLNSVMITSAEGEQGNGGDITVNTDSLIMSGGFVQANTTAIGASGGEIQVNARNTIASQGGILVGGDIRQQFSPTSRLNVIQAAAPDGVSGQVDLSTVELNIAGQLAKVDSNFVAQKTIANDPCNVARNEKMSSLIQTGQGGLPIKASDNINLPLHRHLPKEGMQPQSQFDSVNKQKIFLSANDVCKQELN